MKAVKRPVRALLVMLGIPALALAPVAWSAPDKEPEFRPLPKTSLNFYGSPGLIDMPSAEMLHDGTLATTIGYFGGQTRTTLTFQALPWLSASFRYNGINDLNLFGFSTYYDRSFDVRFRLLKETRLRPAVTLGLQDFAGTGVYAGEYIVATKNFALPALNGGRGTGRLKVTAGLGWGRLGSAGSIGSPFGAARPAFVPGSAGGTLATDQWFRGPMAPFGGIEWRPNDRWGFKAELSSDAYTLETQTSSVFERKSRLNFGAEYQAGERVRLGAYYMYGSEFGLTAQFQLNPTYAPTPTRVAAPAPIQPRPSRSSNPEQWSTNWAQSRSAPVKLRDALAPQLKAEGLLLENLTVTATSAELRYRNTRYQSQANAMGRAARALTRVMPASVETFRLIPMSEGMALSAATVRRSDLEALEFDGQAAAAIDAVIGYGDAPPLSDDATGHAGLYPDFSWSLGPYAQTSYFDPDRPLRLDYGIQLKAAWRPAPGWKIAGALRHRLGGDIAKSNRASNSKLTPVRTDAVKYAQADTTLKNLYATYQWRPGRDLYGRVTVGYLERMFGGLSAELLWKPVNSRLGLGVEANWVKQRDFDQRFGFRDYSVATGHASAYYELGRGYVGQLDVGRYLAGDVGATLSLDRTFDNGWSVGGFFTKTNVSSAEFGEGSFDKGIRFSIPVTWFLGTPGQNKISTTIRPVQRDGGARLSTPDRLYPQIRNAHRNALRAQNARFWE